jgi:hypothetical protein
LILLSRNRQRGAAVCLAYRLEILGVVAASPEKNEVTPGKEISSRTSTKFAVALVNMLRKARSRVLIGLI